MGRREEEGEIWVVENCQLRGQIYSQSLDICVSSPDNFISMIHAAISAIRLQLYLADIHSCSCLPCSNELSHWQVDSTPSKQQTTPTLASGYVYVSDWIDTFLSVLLGTYKY